MLEGLAGRLAFAGLTATALIAFAAGDAEARSYSFAGPHGGTWDRSITHYNNGGGNFGRTVTTTRRNGRTETSAFNRADANGTITDSHSYTGRGGQTYSGGYTNSSCDHGWGYDHGWSDHGWDYRGGGCCYGGGVVAGTMAGLAVGTAVAATVAHPAYYAPPPVPYVAPAVVYPPYYYYPR